MFFDFIFAFIENFAHYIRRLMMNKHPEVIRKGQQLDMSDILSDPVVQFHQKYVYWLITMKLSILIDLLALDTSFH